ncbi:hypothetical protein PR048_021701 [Dryococelus australis]|uniref:Uncharacterized protein n=1 Tax=Dryococelus australis TaxID=614101 RepID=A0ABQ9GYY4_9NEOP|nr:hypothetical protein PR048_021701 [Dryococelus australis]
MEELKLIMTPDEFDRTPEDDISPLDVTINSGLAHGLIKPNATPQKSRWSYPWTRYYRKYFGSLHPLISRVFENVKCNGGIL